MTILGISMISVALQQTGAANALGKLIYKIGGKSETLTVLFVTLFSAILSFFMNNIAAVGILLPAVMSLSRRSRIPPSRLLIPLAFGTILRRDGNLAHHCQYHRKRCIESKPILRVSDCWIIFRLAVLLHWWEFST